MSTRRIPFLLLTLSLVVTAVPAEPAASPTVEDPWVDLGDPVETLDVHLAGVNHPPDTQEGLEALQEAGVPSLRVDAYLREVHPDAQTWNWTRLDARIEAAHALGAEPLLVLAYMPPWMASCEGEDPREPRRCPPADLQTWHEVVERVVDHAAERGVRAFEVWNEPDNPLFFQGTPRDYLAMYREATRAVEDVEDARDLDLDVGGPATVGPDPAYIQGLLELAVAEDLPLDFVSWHWYANSPFLGPFEHDGLPGGEFTLLDHESPAMDPRHYPVLARQVETWIATARAQGLDGDPEQWVTEWNINAGDDPRHRNHEGAAFLAATLAQLEDAPVERAYYFNSQGASWGLVSPAGDPRPATTSLGWVTAMPGDRVASSSGNLATHLHVLAAANGTAGDVVLANLHGSEPRDLVFDLVVEDAPGLLARVDQVTEPGTNASVEVVDSQDGWNVLEVHLPAQSTLRLRFG